MKRSLRVCNAADMVLRRTWQGGKAGGVRARQKDNKNYAEPQSPYQTSMVQPGQQQQKRRLCTMVPALDLSGVHSVNKASRVG